MNRLLMSRHTWGLLVPVAVLCGLSLLSLQALFSLEPTRILAGAAIKQFGFLVAGLFMAWLTVIIGYYRLSRFSYLLFVACVVLSTKTCKILSNL
jgi:hypothetical protein